MLVQSCPLVRVLAAKILHTDWVSVDVYRFITYDELLEFSIGVLTTGDRDGRICNLKAMVPHCQELVNAWVMFLEFYKEET